MDVFDGEFNEVFNEVFNEYSWSFKIIELMAKFKFYNRTRLKKNQQKATEKPDEG